MTNLSNHVTSRGTDALPVSYLTAYYQGVNLLAQAGVSNANNEAMWLLESGLGISRLAVYMHPETPVGSEAWRVTQEKFLRRATHEPLQYILGTQEFRGLTLSVGAEVFIPRPETEMLVDEVVAQYSQGGTGLLADIGTGSGCIAIASAAEIPGVHIYAIDREPMALAMARRNAGQHLVQDRITFIEGNWVEPLYAKGLEACFGCIVSNPPYIPSKDLAALPRTVRDFEPAVALDGGPEGLDFYTRLLRDAPGLLQPGGKLVMEMGAGQAERVCQEAEHQGHFKLGRIREDAAGIARVVCLEKLS